jgi:hypothetical protein
LQINNLSSLSFLRWKNQPGSFRTSIPLRKEKQEVTQQTGTTSIAATIIEDAKPKATQQKVQATRPFYQ